MGHNKTYQPSELSVILIHENAQYSKNFPMIFLWVPVCKSVNDAMFILYIQMYTSMNGYLHKLTLLHTLTHTHNVMANAYTHIRTTHKQTSRTKVSTYYNYSQTFA